MSEEANAPVDTSESVMSPINDLVETHGEPAVIEAINDATDASHAESLDTKPEASGGEPAQQQLQTARRAIGQHRERNTLKHFLNSRSRVMSAVPQQNTPPKVAESQVRMRFLPYAILLMLKGPYWNTSKASV